MNWKTMSKRRKALVGTGVLLLAFFVGWPTAHALVIRARMETVLQQAQSVRLEEFAFHDSLASVELPRSQWSDITAHLPMVPDAGVPGIVKACFIPHHRIVVTSSNQQQFILTVCFACDQATVGKSGIFAVPYLWVSPLRQLFTSHQIRIRSDGEYTDAAFEHPQPRTLVISVPVAGKQQN